jgi:sugar lactone lactonase YvrE
MGITIDSNGDIYATNGSKPGSTLSKILTTGTTAGAITRFGNASFFNLMDIKLDSLRNVYITDAGLQRVYKISTNGTTGIYSGVNVGYNNGPALSAEFNTPDQMVFDTANNLYVCDTNNHCIRRIAANGGVVTTYAGAPPTAARLPTSGNIDGTLAISRFNQPKGITMDPAGNLYVTDSGNKTVRKITPAGQVSTISSGFNQPNGIAIDPTGNLYVVDSGNRSVTMLAFPSYNKSIISIATGTSGWTLPVKIARSSAGTFYVTDAEQNKIWKV